MNCRFYNKLIILLILLGISGCGTFPSRDTGSNPSRLANKNQVVIYSAMQYIGTPYQYGGTSDEGIDCSGLVYLAFQNAGIPVPRTSLLQYRKSNRIHPSRLLPGDLVFFKLERGNPVSHVGIYIGNQRFIHAPRTGKNVEYASLSNSFWNARFTGAGRF
ncbi:MAG: C40 family peptidase [Gammaproteobacteria bacterium]|nr:C40 family peptidase [Gammaproteobacteria bacterium]